VAYCRINFKSKKAMREAVKANANVEVYQPGPFGPDVKDGPASIEGPHYPAPHTWYAAVEVKDGKIVRVVS